MTDTHEHDEARARPDIHSALPSLVEAAFNRYLRLDPEIAGRLHKITGKIIALELTGIGTTLYFVPYEDQVKVLGDCADTPDTVISGSPLALLRMTASKEAATDLSRSGVRIEGDTETGQVFHDAIANVEIDWEELVAGRTGDIVAHELGNLVRGFSNWAQRASDSMSMNVSEYLREESRVLPTRIEIEEFLDNVDTLRSDVDRLEARLARLIQDRVPEDQSP